MFRRFEAYLLMMLAGASLPAMLFAGGLFVLAQADSLPPPPLANRILFDEKLRFLRLNSGFDPRVLAVGSSQTLNHFDARALLEAYGPDVRVLNGSVGSIDIDKQSYLVDFYLSWYKNVEQIIAIVSVVDFTSCVPGGGAFFDRKDAADYAFRDMPDIRYYFRYFAPVKLAINALDIRQRRTENPTISSLVFDRFGAIPRGRQIRPWPPSYERVVIDNDCFGALRKGAENLASKGISYTVVLAPLKPGYIRNIDPDGKIGGVFLDGVTRALEGTGAQLINSADIMEFSDDDFWNATHIYWDVASRLSYEVVSRMDLDGLTLNGSSGAATDGVMQETSTN